MGAVPGAEGAGGGRGVEEVSCVNPDHAPTEEDQAAVPGLGEGGPSPGYSSPNPLATLALDSHSINSHRASFGAKGFLFLVSSGFS